MTRTPVEVGDGFVAELGKYFDAAQIVELTAQIAWENWRARFNHALGIDAHGFSEGAYCPIPEPRASRAEQHSSKHSLAAGPGLRQSHASGYPDFGCSCTTTRRPRPSEPSCVRGSPANLPEPAERCATRRPSPRATSRIGRGPGSSRLFDAGWLVPGWPRGARRPQRDSRSSSSSTSRSWREIPVMRSYNIQGLTIIAPSIQDYGSALQRERYLLQSTARRALLVPRHERARRGQRSRELVGTARRAARRPLRAERSEGLDLGPAHADLCFCFVRTDPEAPKHRGISVLIVDDAQPGHHGSPSSGDHQPRARRLQRGLLRRRRGSRGQPGGRAQPGLGDLRGLAGPREGHALD